MKNSYSVASVIAIVAMTIVSTFAVASYGFYENLSDEQKATFDRITDAHYDKIVPIREQIGEINYQMRNLDESSSDYLDEYTNLANERSELEKQLSLERAQYRKATSDILTPEQLEQVAQYRSERREYRENDRGGRYRYDREGYSGHGPGRGYRDHHYFGNFDGDCHGSYGTNRKWW